MAPASTEREEGDWAWETRRRILLSKSSLGCRYLVVVWETPGNLALRLEGKSFDRRHCFDRDGRCSCCSRVRFAVGHRHGAWPGVTGGVLKGMAFLEKRG